MSASLRVTESSVLFPLLVAGVLAALSYWLEIASRQPLMPEGRARHDPDYLIEDFELRRYSAEGLLQHTLRARQLLHFPDDDSTEVLSPLMIWHRTPPTTVSAQKARMDGEGKHILLQEDVRVVRGAAHGKEETVLLTSSLDVYPDDEIVRTREAVTIRQGASVVTGVGLEANHQTGLAVLDGPVRGTFHRSRSQSSAARPREQATQAAPNQAKSTARFTARTAPKRSQHAR
ncbi:MAG: LPS export ABC transporter periplasmic protein LptC [Rhodocyclaceae bacterium]|nr:LPS export ABC transporter periplasmic protein LptC [Rhodocyclaceae bacterium]